jgi:glycosyltransferase involved in cell wall biosynthesis
MRILTTIDYYLPGCAAGCLRSMANLIDHLGSEFDFRVVAGDRDLGSAAPYPGIHPGRWQRVGRAEVYYLRRADVSLRVLRDLLREDPPDAFYCNSFFSPPFTIKPLLLRKLGLIPPVPVIISPKGEFSRGALATKWLKKRLYLRVVKAVGLYREVFWHVSSDYEAADLRRSFPRLCGPHNTFVIPDLVAGGPANPAAPAPPKRPGAVKLLFLSRIHPVKNLDGALEILRGVPGDVQLDVYGPAENRAYWEKCQAIVATLPGNIQVRYQGPLPHEQVQHVMRQAHLFFLPSHGENYGHVIAEALSAGCPVLLSDRTPWRRLQEKGVGWDLPLDRPEEFRAALTEVVRMDGDAFRAFSGRVGDYAVRVNEQSRSIQLYREMFRRVVEESPRPAHPVGGAVAS